MSALRERKNEGPLFTRPFLHPPRPPVKQLRRNGAPQTVWITNPLDNSRKIAITLKIRTPGEQTRTLVITIGYSETPPKSRSFAC